MLEWARNTLESDSHRHVGKMAGMCGWNSGLSQLRKAQVENDWNMLYPMPRSWLWNMVALSTFQGPQYSHVHTRCQIIMIYPQGIFPHNILRAWPNCMFLA